MREIENVQIIGMGALGMMFGQLIESKTGYEKLSFLLDERRFEDYSKRSFTINGKKHDFNIKKSGTAGYADLLIVAVKSPGLESALDTMAPSIGEDTIIISLLNGISSEEIIAERFGDVRVLLCVAQEMDAMRFASALSYNKIGKLYVGVRTKGQLTVLQRLTRFFDRIGMPYAVDENMPRRLWSKFMLNVGINQTCMVYGTTYGGALLKGSEERMALISAMREVALLSKAEGIDLNESDINEYLKIIGSLTAENMPSMAQDRINGRLSEVDLFAGEALRRAAKYNIEMPVNEYLFRRVKEIESGY